MKNFQVVLNLMRKSHHPRRLVFLYEIDLWNVNLYVSRSRRYSYIGSHFEHGSKENISHRPHVVEQAILVK
jgi:hypothetical protein